MDTSVSRDEAKAQKKRMQCLTGLGLLATGCIGAAVLWAIAHGKSDPYDALQYESMIPIWFVGFTAFGLPMLLFGIFSWSSQNSTDETDSSSTELAATDELLEDIPDESGQDNPNHTHTPCPECGHVLKAESQRCIYCGHRFQEMKAGTPVSHREEELIVSRSEQPLASGFQTMIGYAEHALAPDGLRCASATGEERRAGHGTLLTG